MNKIITQRAVAWAIHRNQIPNFRIMNWSKGNNDSKTLDFYETTSEKAEFQTTRMPPEAPCEGANAKLSNLRGQNWWMNLRSKDSHFVSCKQTMEQLLSSILARTSRWRFSEFKPRTFQHRTFQLRKCGLSIKKLKGVAVTAQDQPLLDFSCIHASCLNFFQIWIGELESLRNHF